MGNNETQLWSDSASSMKASSEAESMPFIAEDKEYSHKAFTVEEESSSCVSSDEEALLGTKSKGRSARARKNQRSVVVCLLTVISVIGWALAIVMSLRSPVMPADNKDEAFNAQPEVQGPSSRPNGDITEQVLSLEQIVAKTWSPKATSRMWIQSLGDQREEWLVEHGSKSGGGYYLNARVVEPLKQNKKSGKDFSVNTQINLDLSHLSYKNRTIDPENAWMSSDLSKVLLVSDVEKVWRHSFTGLYWLLDVATLTISPLDATFPDARIQLAVWSPDSHSVLFVRNNDIFIHRLSAPYKEDVTRITNNGAESLFNGIPDWVYEEEVFESNAAVWWSQDSRYVAFFQTNDTTVTDYTLQYVASHLSGQTQYYPQNRRMKYPKAGSPNPIVHLFIYDTATGALTPAIPSGELLPGDRVIFDVVWVTANQLLMKQTNRESDSLSVFLVDASNGSGTRVRHENVRNIDGGWVEPTHKAKPVPADPKHGREYDGYIDTVIHKGYNHLAYFTPLGNATPAILTSGQWEVVDAPSAIDLETNDVYFIATKVCSTQRHVFRCSLLGDSTLRAVVDTSKPAYYDISFSVNAKHALLTYSGPEVPWESLIDFEDGFVSQEASLEQNQHLRQLVGQYSLPRKVYHSILLGGETLNVVEHLPPHFNPDHRYPLVLFMYGGPGSQNVNQRFKVDFQSYLASQGYIVVTVDGRGTGFNGRRARVVVRDNIGELEAADQIATAQQWSTKSYIDAERMAVWGWSFGGFLTLKVLERDAGKTFKYGMAVAPVTDWRFYDSIHTERHMHTPQHNPDGYQRAAISNMTALMQTKRLLIAHGVADDNVHYQNTLTLIDKLNLANAENYDLLVYPDSDHNVLFHNGRKMLYSRMSQWLKTAFSDQNW